MERNPHLSEEQLAQFRDEELPSAVAAHLEACSECKSRLQAMDQVMSAWADFRNSSQAEPPQPWPDLQALIASHQRRGRRRIFRLILALAAIICIIFASALLLRPGSTAGDSRELASLLERSAREPAPAQRVLAVRLRGRTFTRPAILAAGGSETDPYMARLRGMFAAARYSWREPLSARSFAAWRKGLRQRTDSVSVIGDRYRIRTATRAGVLRSVALDLRADNLLPAAGRFDFESEGPVEFTEQVYMPPAEPRVTPRALHEPSAVERPATPEDVLRVLAALDAIGADAGEPIEIGRDADDRHVVIRAAGLAPDRRQTIESILKNLPKVRLELDSQTPATPPVPAVPEKLANRIPDAFRVLLENRFGGAAHLQDTTDAVLDASSSAVARAHAIQILAENFPPEIAAQMSAADQDLLRGLHQSHLSELDRLSAEMREQLLPVLSTGDPPSASTGSPWQQGVPELIRSARNLDDLLNRLLAGSYNQASGETMLRRVDPVFAEFESAVETQHQPRN